MTTFNTGNPIGSTDARDLSDNAENFDKALGTLDATWVDRLGVTRDSFEGRLAKGSFYRVGTFAAGYALTNMRQTLEYNGHEYSWAGTFPKVVAAGSTPATSGGFGPTAWIDQSHNTLRNDLGSSDAGDGGALVFFKRKALTTFVQSVQGMLDAQYVNVWEFADLVVSKPVPTDPNTWDWTPAFQAALNAVGHATLAPDVSGGCVVIPPVAKNSVYKLTQVDVPIDVAIVAYGATVVPVDQAQARSHLFKFLGMNKVAGLQVAMDFSTTYKSAFWCRGRNIDFVASAVWFAGNAVMIGDPAWLASPTTGSLGDSEISFTNCQFNWCLRTATAYGLNTIVIFGGGSRCYANRGTVPAGHPNEAAWLAAPMGNFLSYGALIYVVGASIGTFERDVPTLTARVMPVSAAEYVNSYGRFIISGSHIETSFLLYAPPESAASQDVTTKGLILDSCQGHIATSTADNYWIEASTQYKQGIDIRGCGFYGSAGVTPTRTKLISAPGASVHATEDSFGNAYAGEFKDACITHHPVDMSNIMLVSASGSSQTITGTPAPLIMPNTGIIDLHNNSRGYYYTAATGIFTASVELKNVELTVDLRYVTPASTNTVQVDLFVGGVIFDTVVLTGGYLRGTLRTRRIAKDTTFYVRIFSLVTASYALDGSAGNKFSLVASV